MSILSLFHSSVKTCLQCGLHGKACGGDADEKSAACVWVHSVLSRGLLPPQMACTTPWAPPPLQPPHLCMFSQPFVTYFLTQVIPLACVLSPLCIHYMRHSQWCLVISSRSITNASDFSSEKEEPRGTLRESILSFCGVCLPMNGVCTFSFTFLYFVFQQC